MIKRQQRLLRIVAVAQEYLAARTAASLLDARLQADPSYGWRQGWEPRAGAAFSQNLEATYIVRMYAEFEAGLRDYWENRLGKTTHPPMAQLLGLLANQHFSQDCIDNAHDVREFRNFLVHAREDQLEAVSSFTTAQAKTHLCDFFGRLDSDW